MASFDYDVLIVFSGFGGSVAALRVLPVSRKLERRPVVTPGPTRVRRASAEATLLT